MPSFSLRSRENLLEVHPLLRLVAHECILTYDFSVVCGHRDEADQKEAFENGKSRAQWLESPHNYKPAFAFDAYTYPINVNNIVQANALGAAMKKAAKAVNVDLLWGGDFKSFKDRPHFELRNWKALRLVGRAHTPSDPIPK